MNAVYVYYHPLPVFGQPAPTLKPMVFGMNHAKRIALRQDKRDQIAVLKEMGPGFPRQHSHHQNLVRQRHAYYGDRYQEDQRVRDQRAANTLAAFAAASPGDKDAGVSGGTIS
jgi:hypothetical protein